MPPARTLPPDLQSRALFRRLFVALVLLMAAVLASALMTMTTAGVREQLNNALQLERDLGLLLSTLQDAETGQRGYLLTQDDSYLTPYHQALDTVGPILRRIGREVHSDSLQQLRLQRVSDLTAEKFGELSQTLVFNSTDRDSLLVLLDSDLGQSIMRQIRLTIEQLRQGELATITRRQAQVDRLGRVTTALQLLGLLGLGTVVYYVSTQLRPSFNRQRQVIADRDAEIEERKRVEQVNNELIDSLAQKNQELDRFAYLASHDLREPARTITNYVEVLEEDYGEQLDPTARGHLQLIHRTADRMRSLIDTLLAFSRVGRGESVTEVRLEEILQEALENIQSAVTRSGAVVEVGPLPSLTGYRVALRQLFQNLLANAVKFHRPGEPPHVVVSGSQQEDTVAISIRDHGIGMTEQEQGRIFNLFTRLHSSQVFEGQGIGLAFCQKIVHLHQGTLTVASQPGHGSTFTVTLPRSADEEASFDSSR